MLNALFNRYFYCLPYVYLTFNIIIILLSQIMSRYAHKFKFKFKFKFAYSSK